MQQRGDIPRWRFYLDFKNAAGLQHLIQFSFGQVANSWVRVDVSDRCFSMHLQQASVARDTSAVEKYNAYLVLDSDFNDIQFPSYYKKPVSIRLASYYKTQTAALLILPCA